MTRQSVVLPVFLFAIALVGAPSMAAHCNGTIVTIAIGPEAIYIDDRSSTPGEFNHWVYLESNGVAGLQSGGDGFIFEDCGYGPLSPPCIADPCAHAAPDSLLF